MHDSQRSDKRMKLTNGKAVDTLSIMQEVLLRTDSFLSGSYKCFWGGELAAFTNVLGFLLGMDTLCM